MFVSFCESELSITNFPEKGWLIDFIINFLRKFQNIYSSIINKFIVANVFGIKFGDEMYSGLVLTDNLGFPIPKDMLVEIVKKFHNGSMFYINVDYQISSSLQGNVLVTEHVRFCLLIEVVSLNLKCLSFLLEETFFCLHLLIDA